LFFFKLVISFVLISGFGTTAWLIQLTPARFSVSVWVLLLMRQSKPQSLEFLECNLLQNNISFVKCETLHLYNIFINKTFTVIVNNRLLFGVFKDVVKQLSGVLLDSIKLRKPFLHSSHLNFEHKHYTSDRNIASDQPNNRVNMGSYFLVLIWDHIFCQKFKIKRFLSSECLKESRYQYHYLCGKSDQLLNFVMSLT
jgi:hypothetical protein